MNDSTPPLVSCSFSLSSNTYSISSNKSPRLSLTLVSHHPTPITVYLENTRPELMRERSGFIVTNIVTGAESQQPCRRICIGEGPKIITYHVPEDKLYELLPGQPVTLSASFGPDKTSSFRSCGSSPSKCDNGVRGLPPGLYKIELLYYPGHWTSIRWWEYGTKEEVLRPDANGKGLDARKVLFRQGPHPPIELDVSSFEPIIFMCTR